MRADDVMVGHRVKPAMGMSQVEASLVGTVMDLSFRMNDHNGLVPSALIRWDGLQEDVWNEVSAIDLDDESAFRARAKMREIAGGK